MRFLVVTEQWFPDYHGGSARVATETAVGLARKGHDVTVIAPRGSGGPVREHLDGVLLLRVLRRNRFPRTFTDPFMVRDAVRAVAGEAFDHVLVHHATVGAFLPRSLGPITYVFHASASLELKHRRSLGLPLAGALASRVLEPALALTENVVLKRSRRVFVLSEFSRGLVEGVRADAAPRVRNVGGGVRTSEFLPSANRDAERASVGVDDDVKVILTVRRLVPRMGLENLIDAVAEVARGPHRVELVVVGGGELLRSLEDRARERNIDVRFVGRVSDEEILCWYRAADLFVLPTVAYEGFGIVTAEALSAGLPVVGTPVGATPEILGPLEPDLVAASSQPDDLAVAITRILDVLTPSLGVRCREFALTELDWSERLEDWIRELPV